jgi:hypothetical protein
VSVAGTTVHAIRPDTMLDTVRTQDIVDSLAAPRATGQVVAVCGLSDDAGGSTVTELLARMVGRLHPGRVVVLDADLDRSALARRTDVGSRIELDDLEAFLRTPSSIEPPWRAAAPVVGEVGAYPADHVTDLLRWSRARLDTVLVDVPSRWRRAVLDSLLPTVDIVVVAAQAGQSVEEEIEVARHWLDSRSRSDLADRLMVVELGARPSGHRPVRRRLAGTWFRLGAADPAAGWSGLSRRDRDELLRLGAALRR